MTDDEKIIDEPEDVYKEKDRDSMTEDEDSMEPFEEGFMEGAEGDGQDAKCSKCGKPLMRDTTIEKEIDGERKFFCSVDCVEQFEKHQQYEN